MIHKSWSLISQGSCDVNIWQMVLNVFIIVDDLNSSLHVFY